MLTCREATQLLSEKQDRILNFKEMSALQFHVLMCSSCRRFGKQMKSLSLLSKQYKKFDEEQKEADSSGKCNSIKTSHNFTRCIPT